MKTKFKYRLSILITSLFILAACLGFTQQIENTGQLLKITIDKDSVIFFNKDVNREFYEYITGELDINTIKRGYYPREKIFFVCEYSADWHLDSIVFSPSGYSGYNTTIKKCFDEVDMIELKGFTKGTDNIRLFFMLYIWEETGDFYLRGYVPKW